MKSDSPLEAGFFMPPEWHFHEATWLSWPTNTETWPASLDMVQETFLEMIHILSTEERVCLLVDDAEVRSEVARRLKSRGVISEQVSMSLVETRDAWIRDYGPNFLLPSSFHVRTPVFNIWKFNAWGGRYPELVADGGIPGQLAELLEARTFQPPLVLEGGAIDVSDSGLCLTTRQCLLSVNRNPGLTLERVEEYLRRYLGIKEALWLERGLAGDDTDGHVDQVARFVNRDTVVCSLSDDCQDPNYALLQDNYLRLSSFKSAAGESLRVVPLPTPQGGEPGDWVVAASYTNFYIANAAVLVPTFGCPTDMTALSRLQELFSERIVLGLDCRSLALGGGTLHCVTQQQPSPITQEVSASA